MGQKQPIGDLAGFGDTADYESVSGFDEFGLFADGGNDNLQAPLQEGVNEPIGPDAGGGGSGQIEAGEV